MGIVERGLSRESYERDSCGFGLLASLDEQPSHWLVHTAIASLNRLTHRGAIAGADFFMTEVWTWRGLVTYYTVFAVDLASRRVKIVGSTPCAATQPMTGGMAPETAPTMVHHEVRRFSGV